MSVLPAREAYRRWAPTYEAENVVTTLDCELVEQLSPSPLGLRLLDVGCGTGRRLVGTGAARAVGVELCEEMLAAGRQAHEFGSEVQLLSGDARALPVPDALFDLIWCRLMVGHLAECRSLFRGLGRVAAIGGHLAVTDFHPAAYEAGLRRTFRDGDEVLEVEHHVHSIQAQVAAATAAGLKLLTAADAVVGPSVRSYYEAAGKGGVYEEHIGMPLVLGLSFVRDG